MATFLWSTLVNGRVIAFSPTADVLRFDLATISASGVTVSAVSAGATSFAFGGKTITLQMPLFAATTTNITFANGSQLIVGDNAVGTTGDHTGVDLTGGTGNDQLIGGNGSDSLDGSDGDDRLAGGAGNDSYFLDSFGDVVVEGANQGVDTVFADLPYTLGANVENLTITGSGFHTGTGNALANVMIGNDSDNELFGLAGNDTLNGEGGDDDLEGGAGADILNGGQGIDIVHYDHAAAAVTVSLDAAVLNRGEAAGDRFTNIEGVVGSAFNDFLVATDDDNFVGGLGGNDYLSGLGGDDSLDGGDGNDRLEGGEGADALVGGAGFDYASYASGGFANADLDIPGDNEGDAAGDTFNSIEGLIGSQFDDQFFGDNNVNDLAGLDGDDTIIGRGGNDTLQGGNGDDILSGDAGADTLLGGAGIDTADYDRASAAVVASMTAPTLNRGDAAGDRYSSVENMIGTDFNDTLAGDAQENWLQGANGNDYLQGFGGADILEGALGNDFLEGGAGADVISGGEGYDYARYDYASAAVIVDLSGAVSNTGDAAGDDIFDIEGVIGSRFADTLQGDDASNDLVGLDGNDNIHGGAGEDVVQGGNGDDTLNGGEDADKLFGGAGNDTFIFSRTEADGDTMLDFNGNGAAAGDRFVFMNYGTAADGASFTAITATMWSINSDDGTVHDIITFRTAPSIHASDFTFIA